MKTSKRIFHILLSILLLHGSTVGFSETICQPKAEQHEESLLALPSLHLISYASKHESKGPLFNRSDYNFPGGDEISFSTVYRITESLLSNKISASLLLSKEHKPRLQNTSIIFPFHTFP